MDEKQKQYLERLLEQLVKKYSLAPDEKFDASLNLAKEMIACQLLIEEIESRNDQSDDAIRVLSYMMVVTNAEKYSLNWMKAYEDLAIDEIVEKYVDFEMKGNLKNEE